MDRHPVRATVGSAASLLTLASLAAYAGAPSLDTGAWIRYVDPRGRPRVRYSTRGC